MASCGGADFVPFDVVFIPAVEAESGSGFDRYTLQPWELPIFRTSGRGMGDVYLSVQRNWLFFDKAALWRDDAWDEAVYLFIDQCNGAFGLPVF